MDAEKQLWLYRGICVGSAKHVIELKQGDQTIFGPETLPVTQATLPDTFRINVDGLNLEANTGVPVYAYMTAYDVSDQVIGTSTGYWTTHYQGGSHTRSWEPAPLYIDNTPPKITGEARELQARGKPVIYCFPKAKEFVKIGDSDIPIKFVNSYANYEYQLLEWNETPDPSAWNVMKGSELVTSLPKSIEYHDVVYDMMSLPQYYSYCLNLGNRPYRDSLKVAVRAKNVVSSWTTGYSNVVTYAIPKIDSYIRPEPATFELVGLDEADNIRIEITKAGSDTVSGISQYGGALEQHLFRSPSVMMEYPESFKFTKDQVRPGAVLTIPVPHDSIDIQNNVHVVLYTESNAGYPNWIGYATRTVQIFTPNPPALDIRFQIEEGMKPFTLTATGPLNPLSDYYIDRIQIRIGTVPDSADIAFHEKSFAELFRLHTYAEGILIFQCPLELPASVDHGSSLYLSARSLRDTLFSDWDRQRVVIYDRMFETVDTDADGFLVLPIAAGAFNGQREASFEWAVGYYVPSQNGQGRYQFNIRPFTSLEGVSSTDVTRGARLKLPIKAGDVRPRSLVALRARALNGEICFTYRKVDITPPAPEVNGTLNLKPLEHDRFAYQLNLNMRLGTRIQSPSGTARAEVDLKIGSTPGAADIHSATVPLLQISQAEFTPKTLYLPDSLAALDKIFVTARGRTAYGKVSSDSTVFSFDIPWPPFCRTAKVTFKRNLSVHALRHGHGEPARVNGYQFAVGSGGGQSFELRPYPSSEGLVDISSANWNPGEDVNLPFSVKDLSYDSYRIGIRAVLTDGSVRETILETTSLIKPVVQPSIIDGKKLRIQGDLDPALMELIYQRELRIDLRLNDKTYFFRTFTVPENGRFDITYNLPVSNMPKGERYTFRSFYQYLETVEFPSWETELRLPGEPLFITADADSQDMIYVDIIREGFYGREPLAGYQFAIGFTADTQLVRSFPTGGDYDFTSNEVHAGVRLTLPQSLAGIPDPAFVTLRAVNESGEFHTTTQSFKARPPKPEIISLIMDQTGRFTARFNASLLDGKVQSMDCWVRQDTIAYYHTIAFTQRNRSQLDTGIVEFDSHFTEDDLNVIFVFEGLHIGYQINSLNFQYRFKIQKVGNDYQIIPLNQ